MKLKKNIKYPIINLGSNKGTSIKEIVNIIKNLYGVNLRVKFEKRRKGDPAKLVASITKAKKILNWYPSNSNITEIIRSNYKFYEKKIKVIHLSFVDNNLSGGDKIFLEYFKNIDFRRFEIEILTNEYGHLIYENYLPKKNFKKIDFNIIKNKSFFNLGSSFSYPFRVMNNLIYSLFLKNKAFDIIISTSDF